jgi:hypothetical protein
MVTVHTKLPELAFHSESGDEACMAKMNPSRPVVSFSVRGCQKNGSFECSASAQQHRQSPLRALMPSLRHVGSRGIIARCRQPLLNKHA